MYRPVRKLCKLRAEEHFSNSFAHIIWQICALDNLIRALKCVLNYNISSIMFTPANDFEKLLPAYSTLQPRHTSRLYVLAAVL